VGGGSPVAQSANESKEKGRRKMASAEQVVRDFCTAVRLRDPEVLRAFFSEDVVYHNIPLEPAEGIDATMEMMNSFLGMFEDLEFEVHHLASDGSTVLTERTDHFTTNGKSSPLPVMGAFHVVDGKITAWRDYFDMGQVSTILGGG
jgi:limonene-1,2-epoxide hydrolase